jgi:hypothetical protein
MGYNVTEKRLRAAIFAVEKAIRIVHLSVWFLDLGNQHAVRMRRVIHSPYHTFICDLYGCTVSSHVISQGQNFRGKKKLLHMKRTFWISLKNSPETFLRV